MNEDLVEEQEDRRTTRRQRIQRLSTQIERLAIQLNQLVVAEQEELQTNQANERGIVAELDNLPRTRRRIAPTPVRVNPNRHTTAEPTLNEEQEVAIEEQQERQLAPVFDRRRQATEIVIGDRVRILNNYQGLRGSVGTVTYTTATQVSLRIDGERRIRIRSRINVARIN